ncbi:MAG: hypothetical protein ACYSUV_09425 [Planctomycetota bacterium]|jgi:hypothetical protein
MSDRLTRETPDTRDMAAEVRGALESRIWKGIPAEYSRVYGKGARPKGWGLSGKERGADCFLDPGGAGG